MIYQRAFVSQLAQRLNAVQPFIQPTGRAPAGGQDHGCAPVAGARGLAAPLRQRRRCAGQRPLVAQELCPVFSRPACIFAAGGGVMWVLLFAQSG